ncbi:unnamed protein product [Aureobasidium uvarum]|uniref:Protein kinase domain-containing protein n=1 Tax=Aureobasidium uvarum TaxID=2773716 RepID=A0A9N8KI86_9PEZI|nr:unnamed protein product [Aureobasidium uvarum]
MCALRANLDKSAAKMAKTHASESDKTAFTFVVVYGLRPSIMAEQLCVGTLTFVNQRRRIVFEDAMSIWPKQEIQLGCRQLQQLVDDYDQQVSYHHLVLRCVQFDEDAAAWNVAPMVYAEDLSTNGTTLARECAAEDGSTVRLDHQLTKSLGPVLLRDGDCLHLSKSTFVQYHELNSNSELNMSFIMDCEVKRFQQDFTIHPRLIGAGGQGQVFVACDRSAGQQVACKVVSLAGVDLKGDQDANEASIQAASNRASRMQSIKLLRKIHRLEVEYEILKDLNHPGRISRMFSTCGTYGFTAPEINRLNPTMAENKGYSSAIDLWSVDCVSALMLTGSLAFNHRDGDQDIGQINSRSVSAYDLTQIEQGEQSWEGVPKRVREFVSSLLTLQEDKRLTAKKALEHSWFTNHICTDRFDAIYEMAIGDWKPSPSLKGDIVVNIDTSDIVIPAPSASQIVRQRSESAVVQSKFFQAQEEYDDNQMDMSSTPGRFTEQELDNDPVLAASPASQPSETFEALPLNTAAQPKLFYSHTSLYSKLPPRSSGPDQDLDVLQPSARFRPPKSSDPDQDLDSLKPSAQLGKLQASPELTWPSSPPNKRKMRLPSPEFPWL